jgi:ABC-type transport system involved in multi-copper enzyme maturation permease subunit
MTQTLALLLDAYRELNSKKLFWITLGLSGLVVAVFAGIGVSKNGMTVFFWTIPIPGINTTTLPPETFYKLAFVQFGIGFWLAWIATILALVSTAPIFPDFLAGGAIELVLSKPIGRLRLFLTKYGAGLLFVMLQVAVFALACFLVIGLRGGVWDWRIFLAIPIVLCFFSYLFGVCVLLGMVTRSTIASLLGTLLFWFFLFMLNSAEMVTLTFREREALQVSTLTARIERMEAGTSKELDKRAAAESPAPPEGEPAPPAQPPKVYTQAELDTANPMLPGARRRLSDAKGNSSTLAAWNRGLFLAKTGLPKTAETVEVLRRSLLTKEEMKKFRVGDESADAPANNRRSRNRSNDDEIDMEDPELAGRIQDVIDQRSLWWVIGTSLGFEGIVLLIAGWIFVRRDF